MPPTEQGLIIKRHRLDHHWTVRRMAREAKLSAGYVSQLENGRRPVTARVMGEVADALGIPPYELLSEGGFIPAGHLQEAVEMAQRALDVPSIRDKARGSDDAERLDWLTVDYLYMLGDDPYGTGWDGGPGGNHADWTPLVPDAPTPLPLRLKPQLNEWLANNTPTRMPSVIEGWDELSEADQRFVQQMVNKLRRPTAGE
jgi:transcriptional regulator with XRE-family HTH domain